MGTALLESRKSPSDSRGDWAQPYYDKCPWGSWLGAEGPHGPVGIRHGLAEQQGLEGPGCAGGMWWDAPHLQPREPEQWQVERRESWRLTFSYFRILQLHVDTLLKRRHHGTDTPKREEWRSRIMGVSLCIVLTKNKQK